MESSRIRTSLPIISAMVVPSSPSIDKQQQRERRSKIGGLALLAGCLLYIAVSITEPSSLDYDHDIPSNRFMPAANRRSMLSESEQSDTDTAAEEVEKPHSSGVAKLRIRSPKEATEIRRRAVRAATSRARQLEGVGESELTKEVYDTVYHTATALDIPKIRQQSVKPYDIDGAMLAERGFQREVLFFVYDSATDDFVVVHNEPTCEWGCKRAYVVAPVLAYALRKNYPERFQGAKSGDLIFLMSVGDMPRVRRPCLFEENKYCKSERWAPVLQFGSVLADDVYMPSAIAMPQSPRPHIPCFDEYQVTGQVCQALRPRVMNAQSNAAAVDGAHDPKTGQHFQRGLVFGKELGLLGKPDYWDNLIPQVIWRGTDFMFLHTLFPDMRAPTYEEDIKDKEHTFKSKTDAIKALWELGDDVLTPRWRGVLLTSEAELEHEKNDAALPWVNIKFASYNVDGEKVAASENKDFQLLQDKFGVSAIGQSMNMMEHAQYKYHIDLGGGGGTTWTGTIEKLALPGVLFHHVTPTKDWFHDHLEPWKHYIPVAQDLSDLREQFEWAERNPQRAQRIAEAGTEFARWIGTPEGFGQLYQEHIVNPLGNIILSHQKPRKVYKGVRELDILVESKYGESFGVVARCGGWPSEASKCRWTSKTESGKGAPLDIE